jgi:hypothetical protein
LILVNIYSKKSRLYIVTRVQVPKIIHEIKIYTGLIYGNISLGEKNAFCNTFVGRLGVSMGTDITLEKVILFIIKEICNGP